MYPNFYNPMYSQQQRLLQMEQMQNQNMQQANSIPQMQQQNQFIKGRCVSCLEEARASMIDLDGSIFVFPDIANKRIYTKQIGNDGLPIFNIYEMPLQGSNLTLEQQNYQSGINILQDKISALEVKIEVLEGIINSQKGGVKNDEQSYGSNV